MHDGRDQKEIKSRIGVAVANKAFHNLNSVLRNETIILNLRKWIMKCYLCTDCIGSTHDERRKQKEITCIPGVVLLKIIEDTIWTDFLRSWQEWRKILVDVKHRKLEYVAHKIREIGIFMLAVQERIQGKPL